MPEIVDPIKVYNIARLGFKRMEFFCKVRAMMFKSYVGQYGRELNGLEGAEPINLVFNNVRAYVPNLVMQNPITNVTTPYLPYREYAEKLGLALDTTARQINLKSTLRAWITNALFGWGIMKVGLKAKGELLNFDDIMVDMGQIYAAIVNLDNFCIDPTCTDIRLAKLLGNRTTVSRQQLLDTNGYDHDVVKALPSSPSNAYNKLSNQSSSNEARAAMAKLQDDVDVVELYIPEVESIVTMGDPTQKIHGKYLKVADFNGPKEGPYVFLSFSPPVEGNPFPVAPVRVWYDLHRMVNRVFNKISDQVDEQKETTLYSPALVDTVDEIASSKTGDKIPCTDPKGINVISMGGQSEKNVEILNVLQTWANYMGGNPDQMVGSKSPGSSNSKESATKSQILQGNASIGIEDMRDIVSDQTAEVQRRIAWYLHTDPLIDLPLTKRSTGGQETQLRLTPEDRMGDFIDYVFKIVARSMTPMDPMVRSKRIIEFCTNIVPGAATTALAMMQIGQQFNIVKYLTQIAFEMGIQDIAEEIFNDPEFDQKMQIMMMLGPKNAGKAGGNSPVGAQQNNGNPMARPVATPEQEFNAQVQDTAAMSQSINQGVI